MFGFELTLEDIHAGAGRETHKLLYGERYKAVAKASCEAVLAGNHGAYYVPAVLFVLRSTVNTLGQPEIHERLPLEVAERSLISQKYARTIVEAGGIRQLETFYASN
ncbi:MAG TPA: hypothetical protein VMY99_04280 [Nevskiaceae bacterium]|nr:hypothetical protein [Nevskiaceae bacterium]